MSEENVEIVRRLAKGFQRGDYEDAFNFYDLDIEWDGSAIAEISPDLAGVHRGHDGVRSFSGVDGSRHGGIWSSKSKT